MAILLIVSWTWKKNYWICFIVCYMFLVFAETVLIRSSGELRYKLIPLWSWIAVFKTWPISQYGMLIFKQIILNIVIFIPIGIVFSRKYGWKAVLLAACWSMFIEVMQLISRRGIFEIDDLIHNSLGAAIGCWIQRAAKETNGPVYERIESILKKKNHQS